MKDTVKKSDLARNTTLKRYRPTTGETSLSSFMAKHRRPSNMGANKAVKDYMRTMRGK